MLGSVFALRVVVWKECVALRGLNILEVVHAAGVVHSFTEQCREDRMFFLRKYIALEFHYVLVVKSSATLSITMHVCMRAISVSLDSKSAVGTHVGDTL